MATDLIATDVLGQACDLFDRLLRNFVPAKAYDIHAHLGQHVAQDFLPSAAQSEGVGIEYYRRQMQAWMQERAPHDALFFPYPSKELDVNVTNDHCLAEVAAAPGSKALVLVRPNDPPSAFLGRYEPMSRQLAGFKVYHLYASRSDTMNCEVGEFLPEWAWELADAHQLLIMLHLVRSRALADPLNLQYIREHCARYRNSRLVLRHAARAFCSLHTVEAIGALRGLGNLYFDTSAICESAALQAILSEFGPRRLMFGTDFPISNLLGRCSSVGDGFRWLHPDSGDAPSPLGEFTFVGIESLLALKQSCQLARLSDEDVERIFFGNAEELLSLNRAG